MMTALLPPPWDSERRWELADGWLACMSLELEERMPRLRVLML